MATIINAIQGSEAWVKHRSSHFNASDAPAMLGVSSYKTRGDLLREKKTGIVPDVDAATQKRFDDGHKYEATARPWAEEIVDAELYPVVLADEIDGLPLSASLDGLTVDDSTAFEHKTGSERVIGYLESGVIPEEYRIQMEQQMLLSGAMRCLFMASSGDREQMRYCWYERDPELQQRIIAGWHQFAADLETYEPPAAEKPVTGTAPSALPALRIELSGAVAESNLDEFRDHAIAVFEGINTDLQTDEQFADAESTVKWCAQVEKKLSAAKEHALSQTEDIDRLFKTIDEISEQARKKRLELDKLVKSMKEERKREIFAAADKDFDQHIGAIERELESLCSWPVQMRGVSIDIAGAMKGKRTIATLRNAAETAVANAKVEADRIARGIRANLEMLTTEAADHETLFPDGGQLAVSKTADDLHNTIAARIAEHEERERQRAEAKAEAERRQAEANAKREAQREAVAETKTDDKPVSIEQRAAQLRPKRPSNRQIIECVADAFNVDRATARDWIAGMALSETA